MRDRFVCDDDGLWVDGSTNFLTCYCCLARCCEDARRCDGSFLFSLLKKEEERGAC